MPAETMLCTLWVRAYVSDGTLVARNYVQFFVDGGCAPRRRRRRADSSSPGSHSWETAEWKQGSSSRDEAAMSGAAHGVTRGFFEWNFPFTAAELRVVHASLFFVRHRRSAKAHRKPILCSAHHVANVAEWRACLSDNPSQSSARRDEGHSAICAVVAAPMGI